MLLKKNIERDVPMNGGVITIIYYGDNGPVRSYMDGEYLNERYNYLYGYSHALFMGFYYPGIEYFFRGKRQGPFIYPGHYNEYMNYFLNDKSKTLN